MKSIFSRQFRDDLSHEEGKYREISERLAGSFRGSVVFGADSYASLGGYDTMIAKFAP